MGQSPFVYISIVSVGLFASINNDFKLKQNSYQEQVQQNYYFLNYIWSFHLYSGACIITYNLFATTIKSTHNMIQIHKVINKI